MLGAYNGVLISGVRVSNVVIPREKAHLHLICVVGWATLHERGGAFPQRSAILHVSTPGHAAGRAPPLPEVKSRPPGLRHHLTCPGSYSPSLWQGMAPSSLRHAPSGCAGGEPPI
jgi:hypothetical protein